MTTVSRVLSGQRQGFTDSTVASVLQAAAELGYLPRRVGAGLSSGKVLTVAVLTFPGPSFVNALAVSSLFRSLAAVHGLQPLAVPCGIGRPAETLAQLAANGLVAAIAATAMPGMEEVLASLPPETLLVAFNWQADSEASAQVEARPGVWLATDRAAGAEMAVDHLVSLGHSRIGVVRGRWLGEKVAGYQRAMARHGLPVSADLVFDLDPVAQAAISDADMGYALAGQLLAADNPPTALLCSSDEAALGVMARLHREGWQLPRDLSIVGFDGIPPGAHFSPTLTTVAQPYDQLAEQCVRLIRWWLESGLPPGGTRMMVAPSLVVRGSTAPPRADGDRVGTAQPGRQGRPEASGAAEEVMTHPKGGTVAV